MTASSKCLPIHHSPIILQSAIYNLGYWQHCTAS